MSVHKAISNHVNKQNKRINEFIRLDKEREHYIEIALQNCREGKPFTTDRINVVTARINELAKQGIIPTRKLVTIEMIEDYAGKME